MSPTTLLLLLVCVALNTIAQMLLKAGVTALGGVEFRASQLWRTLWSLVFEWHIFIGLVCYVASVVVWLSVLSQSKVSVAYPMSSLGYITTAVAAWYLLDEPLTPVRIGGILVIILGVYLIART